MTETIHILPTAPLAERVLLPGDPGRALLLAQSLLEQPKMFNHNRGLWGYTGEARDGAPLTIQATGMGGPSAAIVIAELIALGAQRFVRVGTCGALDGELALGDLLVATEALAADGTSRALGADGRVAATPDLLHRLRSAAGPDGPGGPIVSTDLFYDAPDGIAEGWRRDGARAVEMEAAVLFTLAARHQLQAGCALVVSDVVGRPGRIDPDALRDGEHRLGELAFAALAG